MLRDFVAIDFETANEQPCSVCSVGIVIVKDGEVAQYFCQRVHGLSARDTDDAPVFPYVWEEIEKHIEASFPDSSLIPFVAHNARFDAGCLRAVFRVYQMDYPDYRFFDTLTASRRWFGRSLPNHQLQTVAAACGYDLLNHHHALADAEACAAIALCIL